MSDQIADYSSIDSFHVNRRRKPNFTDQEVLTIVDQYDKNKEYLHSREASKNVIARKQAIWRQITDKLNASYPQVERTVDDVRRKWKKLQSEAKREANSYRTAQQAGTTTSISAKQISLYTRILSICRPSPTSSSPFTQPSDFRTERRSSRDIPFNDQLSDKVDSPSSEIPTGQIVQVDSPVDESPNFVQDENSTSPKTNVNSFPNAFDAFSNGQISRRTWEKRRKFLKPSPYVSGLNQKSFVQQQNSLRYEALLKRKRSLDLTLQRLTFEKERFLLEQKSIQVQLAINESEQERIHIEKRRVDSAIQKAQNDLSNENNQSNFSENEDHDDNQSFDQMSEINE